MPKSMSPSHLTSSPSLHTSSVATSVEVLRKRLSSDVDNLRICRTTHHLLSSTSANSPVLPYLPLTHLVRHVDRPHDRSPCRMQADAAFRLQSSAEQVQVSSNTAMHSAVHLVYASTKSVERLVLAHEDFIRRFLPLVQRPPNS